jgi:hypothetical protein
VGGELKNVGLQENAGNDPSTQIVPSGGGGSWQKPEEQQVSQSQQQTSALTAGSNWATPSALRGDGSSAPWQPPDLSFPVTPSLPPGDRRLNPREYPSLAAAAASKPSGLRQPVPSVPDTSGQVQLVAIKQLPKYHLFVLVACWFSHSFVLGFRLVFRSSYVES